MSESMIELMVKAARAERALWVIASPMGNRPCLVYRVTDGVEADEPSFTGADDDCCAFVAKHEMRASLTAAESAGYVIVPREPTEGMIAAAEKPCYHSDRSAWHSLEIAREWKAMISAAKETP